MNLDYIKTFIEVVKLGNFSEAAKKLAVSQPAISFQVQKLERELGVLLLDRSQKKLALTEAGRSFLRFAESVEMQHERLQQEIMRLREDIGGDLMITASTIPGEFLLPKTLAEFRTLHPAVKARVEISDSINVINAVRDGSYDVGFCGTAPEAQDIEALRVAGDEIVLIVFPAHPFARRSEIQPAELAGAALIFREETSGTQRSLERLLSDAGVDIKKWRPVLVLGSTQAVVEAVEAGTGIAFVSSLALRKSLKLGLLRQVKVNGVASRRDFYCIYRKGKPQSRLLEEFITFIQAAVPLNREGD